MGAAARRMYHAVTQLPGLPVHFLFRMYPDALSCLEALEGMLRRSWGRKHGSRQVSDHLCSTGVQTCCDPLLLAV
jgi:hypothetical protein